MIPNRGKHDIYIFLLQYQYLLLESALAMMSLSYLQVRFHFFSSLSTLWCHSSKYQRYMLRLSSSTFIICLNFKGSCEYFVELVPWKNVGRILLIVIVLLPWSGISYPIWLAFRVISAFFLAFRMVTCTLLPHLFACILSYNFTHLLSKFYWICKRVIKGFSSEGVTRNTWL